MADGEIYLLRGEWSRLTKIGASGTVGVRPAVVVGHYGEALCHLHSILSNGPSLLDGALKRRYRKLGRGPRVNEWAFQNATGRTEWYDLTEEDLQELTKLERCDVDERTRQIIATVTKPQISDAYWNTFKERY